ncbi:crotonase/enoyl-CoA hydratase family protein [Benzoatithermus flavus]|uniref:Crotonase/enoyl-CoA hydratase family protein n=1 Tax=Benzoatithermus flavus TaxID=3108223 RepID=A0ABU8XM27_9PROT
MAVARSELRTLIGRVDNDNAPDSLPVRPAVPVRPPRVRPDALELEYDNILTRLEPETGILWAWMRHPERACFTPGLMADGRHFQEWLRATFGGRRREEMPFRHLVWASRATSAWSLGGDLATFTRLIRAADEAGLRAYAYRSIDVLHDNYQALDLPIMTVALVQGDAIGGGFEAMLTNDLVVAERSARFGLPEILFDLFPGMGAYSLLRRRVGERTARTLIEDGKTRSADELLELGLVDIVCDPGEGEAVLRRHLAERAHRFGVDLTLKRVRRRSDPLGRSELIDIVDLWVEQALCLGEASLRRMDCLARHQERRRAGR